MQTGSGKTHTMLGDIEGGTRRHSVNCGMTPRVFEYLFSRIQKVFDFPLGHQADHEYV
jgi:kinesin family protein 15